jgi:hypothetical protein
MVLEFSRFGIREAVRLWFGFKTHFDSCPVSVIRAKNVKAMNMPAKKGEE